MKAHTLILLAFCLIASVAVAQDKDGAFHLDKEYPVKPEATLHLRISDAHVYVTGGDRKTAHVKVDRTITAKGITFGTQSFTVDVTPLENGDLTIKDRISGGTVGFMGYYNEKYDVVVELPRGMSLDVKGNDGDYHVTYLNGDIRMDLDDADLEVMGCGSKSYEFRMDDGKIKMDQGKGSLVLDLDDADATISGGAFTSIDSESNDGNIIIETAVEDNGNYRLRAHDGLLAFSVTKGGGQFEVSHDDSRVTAEGDFKEVSDSDDQTVLSLQGGNAKVYFRTNDARVKLARR